MNVGLCLCYYVQYHYPSMSPLHPVYFGLQGTDLLSGSNSVANVPLCIQQLYGDHSILFVLGTMVQVPGKDPFRNKSMFGVYLCNAGVEAAAINSQS